MPSTRTAFLRTAAAVAAMLAGLAACESPHSGAGGGSSAAHRPVGNLALKVSNSPVGPILTDSAGRTLYAFTQDKDTTSTCTDSCIATWPAFTAGSKPTAGSGVRDMLVSSANRVDGASQVAYGKWPLYYYAGDFAAGQLNGQGVDGAWFAVSPDGKLVRTGAQGQTDGWQSVNDN